jgi:hypothetical protein
MSNEEKNDNEISSQEKSLPFFMKVYPKLDTPETDSDFKKLSNFNTGNKNRSENEKDKGNEELILTKEFLEKLIKNPNSVPKSKIYEIVSTALKTSKLIGKMEDNNKTNKKLTEEDLCNACAQKFRFKKIPRGEIIFRIGDDGDKFYYILKGRVNILKIREIPNIYMSIIEYIRYCIFLIKIGENYLFQEVIRKNNNILRVISDEDIFILFRIWFKSELISQINQHLIDDEKTLEDFFKLYEQKFEDYDLDIKELEILELIERAKFL